MRGSRRPVAGAPGISVLSGSNTPNASENITFGAPQYGVPCGQHSRDLISVTVEECSGEQPAVGVREQNDLRDAFCLLQRRVLCGVDDFLELFDAEARRVAPVPAKQVHREFPAAGTRGSFSPSSAFFRSLYGSFQQRRHQRSVCRASGAVLTICTTPSGDPLPGVSEILRRFSGRSERLCSGEPNHSFPHPDRRAHNTLQENIGNC